jgi:hypothetical protein
MSTEDNDFLWIKTRDGSPTIWSNALSEPFRSTKGAFSESWIAFVKPALLAARSQKFRVVNVGEFGLGPGTNWVLWSVAAELIDIDFNYFVIEKELRYFEAGLQKWAALSSDITQFVSKSIKQDFGIEISQDQIQKTQQQLAEGGFVAPQVFADVESAVAKLSAVKLDIWFHDPFGYAVNPEGYSAQVLGHCAALWARHVAGFSYACNRQFRDALESLGEGIVFKNCETGDDSLKRNRSEFYGSLYPNLSALK